MAAVNGECRDPVILDQWDGCDARASRPTMITEVVRFR